MKHDRKIIYLAGFLFSIPVALVSYINSSFISSFIGERTVGIVYILGSIGSVLSLLFAPDILKKVGAYKFLLSVILLDSFSFFILASTKSVWTIVAMFVLGFSMNTLIIFSLDELLKIFSKNSVTGKIRGIYLMLCNFAWILAQLAYGTVLGGFSFRTIYLLGFFVMLFFLGISFLGLKRIPEPKYDRVNSLNYMGKFFKNKNLLRAYGINFLLQFFYCWMIIYTPIYLYAHLDFDWKEIGIIFTIMLLPFVFIQLPLGEYSDKIGERKMLVLGFLIASLATISLFFIKIHAVWIWALLLFSTRIGAAIIEVMSDVHFFRHINKENDEFISIYRNATPVSYILAPIVAFIVFYFVPSFNFIFLLLGTFMLYGAYLASTIKNGEI